MRHTTSTTVLRVLTLVLALSGLTGALGACALFDSAAATTYAVEVATAKHAAELARVQAENAALAKGATMADAQAQGMTAALAAFEAKFTALLDQRIAAAIQQAGSGALTGNVLAGGSGLLALLMALATRARVTQVGQQALAQVPNLVANLLAPPAPPVAAGQPGWPGVPSPPFRPPPAAGGAPSA